MDSDDKKITQLTQVTSLSDSDLFVVSIDVGTAPKTRAIKKSDAIIATGGADSVVVQAVYTKTGAVATGTTTVPNDDTIPQNTEGDQYMSLAITPTNASNKLFVEVFFVGSHSAGTPFAVMLFHDSVANADAATLAYVDTATGIVSMGLNFEMVAGTTSAMTFKVRAGGIAAGTTTFNGSVGGRKFGGVLASSIRITEVLV